MISNFHLWTTPKMDKAKIGALDFEQNKLSGPLMKNKS